MFNKKTKAQNLMGALENAHSASVKLRKSLDNDDLRIKQAFDFSLRISEILRDVGNDFRLNELRGD